MSTIIYAMHHLPTGSMYIGSTINMQQRKSLWRKKFAGKLTPVPPYVSAISTDFNEWVFIELARLSSLTSPTNAQMVERAVIREQRLIWGDKIINATDRATRPYSVTTLAGEQITLKEAAARAGVSTATIQRRLGRKAMPR